MEMVRSTDEQLPETIEAHYLNACLNMQGEQEEQKVQGLVRELEVAFTTLSGKNTVIEELNREVESLRSLVKRLEQRNSQLQYKDSSTTDPERYFQYQELCDSLVRYGDILHILRKNIELSNEKQELLVVQFSWRYSKRFQLCTQMSIFCSSLCIKIKQSPLQKFDFS